MDLATKLKAMAKMMLLTGPAREIRAVSFLGFCKL